MKWLRLCENGISKSTVIQERSLQLLRQVYQGTLVLSQHITYVNGTNKNIPISIYILITLQWVQNIINSQFYNEFK